MAVSSRIANKTIVIDNNSQGLVVKFKFLAASSTFSLKEMKFISELNRDVEYWIVERPKQQKYPKSFKHTLQHI